MVDSKGCYAELITKVLRGAAVNQPRLQNLKINAVCDKEVGQFLMIGTGWEQSSWKDMILFHAWLKDGKVIVEEDNFEAMVAALVDAGVAAEDILSADELAETEQVEGYLRT
jgi:XisI protein